MDPHVTLERLEVAEVRSTDLAGVWLLSGVDQDVSTEVGDLETGGKTMKTVTALKHGRRVRSVWPLA